LCILEMMFGVREFRAALSCAMLFFSSALISCGKPPLAAPREAQTLREAANLLDAGTPWTQPLQKVVAVSGRDARIDAAVVLSPLVLIAADGVQESAAVYPSLPGFGGLFTGSLNASQRRTLDGFCTAMLSGGNADAFIADGRIYTLVLFRYNSPAASGGTFTDYLLGEPLLDSGQCRCPVRFFSRDGSHTDVFVYLVQSGGDWKIEQIAYKDGEGR